MEAYLDNSATTRCYEEVKDIVVKTMMDDYGNPSAMHQKGVESERYVKEAAGQIAATLKVQEKEIYFTSGGTESNNWALIGTALANRRQGNHIIISSIEHPAVSAPAEFLESQGFEVTRLGVNAQGQISPEELKEAIRPETILVSVMFVNNEIGAVEPIAEIGELIKQVNPKTYFHVDAIQAYGKFRILPKKMHIDMLSASGHKIHGPKGTGFLYISEKMKIVPIIYGGGQQKGMRSGTDNVPGIAGLGLASKIVYDHLEENDKHMRGLHVFRQRTCKDGSGRGTRSTGRRSGTADRKCCLRGREKRSLITYPGRKRYLRIRRKCLLYAQKKWKSYTDSYWTAEESDGSNRSVQLL